jgi:hypothetical protein
LVVIPKDVCSSPFLPTLLFFFTRYDVFNSGKGDIVVECYHFVEKTIVDFIWHQVKYLCCHFEEIPLHFREGIIQFHRLGMAAIRKMKTDKKGGT